MQEEDKRMKVKKGTVTVRVGLEEDEGSFQKFVIPISYLYHPLFKTLLESAQEKYGYRSSGPLKLPCAVDDFLHLCWLMERESHGGHHSHHSFSLHSC